ncbi:MAG TPA: VCBS repeat-containing protein [Pyrinomonadaceae bacterium]|nr:VCBS repeat-containing protein [Pyrinomonadaceae bacterium]
MSFCRKSNLSDEPDRTYSAALADIDLDRDLDIVVSNDSPDPKKLFKNDGKGHFTAAGSFGEATWSTRYVTLADLDGDKYPDIMVANKHQGWTYGSMDTHGRRW